MFQLTEILHGLSLETKYIDMLKTEVEIRLQETLKDKNQRLKIVTSEYETLNEKVNSLEEKYISNKISQSTYEKWHPVYTRDLHGKAIELKELKKDGSETVNLYNNALPYLSDLEWIYRQAKDVESKQSFLKGIFWGGFTKEKTGGRTGLINPMFYENALKIGYLLRVNQKKIQPNMTEFSKSTRDRGRTGTIAMITGF